MGITLNTCSACGHEFETMYKNETTCLSCAFEQKESEMTWLWSLLDNENGYYTPMANVCVTDRDGDTVHTMMYNMSYYGMDRARNVLNGVKQFITKFEQFGSEWHKVC